MEPVYIIGSCSTRFQRWPERDFRDLTREATMGALGDAGLDLGSEVEAIYFGNCAMGVWGQANIRGQVALGPLQRERLLAERAPIFNVEGACATGSVALQGAVKHIAAGGRMAMAVGVEKVFVPDDPVKTFGLFSGGIDQLHKEEWAAFYAEAGERGGQAFEPHPARVVFLDLHAMQARQHMAAYGSTVEQLAAIASKNHAHGVLNPKAQYRFEVSVEKVLADKPVIEPFTRSMCSPISDGAAAVLLCDRRGLAACPPAVRERAIRVRACSFAGGTWRELHEDNLLADAAARAYAAAKVEPGEVDIAEVHDATAFCELQATELLGFCGRGEGGHYAESGATAQNGERPINLSGGLESKGHPLAATGLGMIDELVLQLRGEAGDRQAARPPQLALAQNAGGMIGFDEALCAVSILERA